MEGDEEWFLDAETPMEGPELRDRVYDVAGVGLWRRVLEDVECEAGAMIMGTGKVGMDAKDLGFAGFKGEGMGLPGGGNWGCCGRHGTKRMGRLCFEVYLGTFL